ncbi:MAG TPA: ABC transporter permease [Bacillota bacterium]|nr:ABC transporter permease [Bacillota bacterium]
MRQTFKIAAWEIKRNMKNKSFIISLFLTPAIIALFIFIPTLFDDSDSDPETIHIFVDDELGVFPMFESITTGDELTNWDLKETTLTHDEVIEQLKEEEQAAYVSLNENVLEDNVLTVYTSDVIDDNFTYQVHIFGEILKQYELEQLSLTDEELAVVTQEFAVDMEEITDEKSPDEAASGAEGSGASAEESYRKIIPGIVSGIILFSIVISGMMIFQSASQEKKDKIAEIILSSVTPSELMQGKIIGYFALGIIQVIVWLGLASPVVLWKVDMPIFKYLFVPELAVFLTIAILGYLIFASLFVGLGATIEDVSTSGNFQGLVFMLPFIPFMLLGPVITDPNGIVAKVGSFIPLTSPGILLFRLTMIEEWPKLEIALCIVILLVSVWLLMKLAGKVFQTGILLYGKNATPREIWRWLWM